MFVHSSRGIHTVCVRVLYANVHVAQRTQYIYTSFVIKMFFSFLRWLLRFDRMDIIQCEHMNARHRQTVAMCKRMRMALLYVLGFECIFKVVPVPCARCRHKAAAFALAIRSTLIKYFHRGCCFSSSFAVRRFLSLPIRLRRSPSTLYFVGFFAAGAGAAAAAAAVVAVRF